MTRVITFKEAINEALFIAMEIDPHLACFGLGSNDPKRVFGTMSGLVERFGNLRVFDTPTAENAMTGIGIGAALNGVRTVMCHQRLDFFLLAMDQLVNNAAKWSYMFGGQSSVPMVIRLILGRGWGQGPTHSQNLSAWFAHLPGLKVVEPTTPADAKGLMISSIFDPDPVIFLEHRWLHESLGPVPEGDYRLPLNGAAIRSRGRDITIVAMSYLTVEAEHARKSLEEQGVQVTLIDLRSFNPIDFKTIYSSVVETGRLLVLDPGHRVCSVGSEIIARVNTEFFGKLKCAPVLLAAPDHPCPSSPAIAKFYYQRAENVIQTVGQMIGRELDVTTAIAERTGPDDVPGDWFKGPF